MSGSGDKIRSANFVALSTILHAGAILSIALSPHYFPEMMGANSEEGAAVEVTVDTETIETAAIPAQVAEVAPAPVVVEKKVAAPKVKTAKVKAAPVEVAAEPIVAQPAVEVTDATDSVLAEESPVVVEEAPAVDEEKLKAEELAKAEAAAAAELAEKTAAEAQAQEEARLLAENAAKEKAMAEEAARIEAERIAAEKLAAQEAAKLAAEAEARKQAEAAAAAQSAQGKGSGTGSGDGNGAEKMVVKQDYLQLRQQAGNQPPAYPRELRLKKVEGRGQLVYDVTRDGRVTNMRLIKSSGSSELDQVAMDAFKKYKFVPGQEGSTVHNFEFTLKGPAEVDGSRLRTSYK